MLQKAFALIAAIAAADDENGRARLICDGAPAAMRQPESVEAIAAAVLTSEDPQAEAASALLSAALDEARMARENGLPEGAALIAAVEERFAEENEARPFPIQMRGRLARIHARAGLVPPAYAVLTPEVIAAEGRGVEVVPNIDALFAGILRDVGDAPLQVHAALSELLAGLMPDARAMLAGMIVERPGALEARLGLYWLLDPDPDLRLAAATALLRRAEGRSLGAEAARLLPAVRKWLPAEPARAAVDATLRRWMQGGGAVAEPLKVRIARTAASLPDGVGAQSLVSAIQIGGQKGVAMAMLKQGHGVKDAFILPCTNLREQRLTLERIQDEINVIDIDPEALAGALARASGEGLAAGLCPAPGLVELLEADALVPAPPDTEATLAAMGAPERLAAPSAARRGALVKDSAHWMDRFGEAATWFEDTAELRAAIARTRTDKGRETAVWKQLETRRDWWARHFAVCAATLKAGPETADWLSFAAVADALLDGRSMKRIPIMAGIAARTLEAWQAMQGAPSNASTSSGIGALLAHAGIGEAYLHGYLTALAISPRMPSHQDWLGPLLDGIEFPGEGALQHLLDALIDAANGINEAAADQTSWPPGSPPSTLRDCKTGRPGSPTSSPQPADTGPHAASPPMTNACCETSPPSPREPTAKRSAASCLPGSPGVMTCGDSDPGREQPARQVCNSAKRALSYAAKAQ
ncbi:MAG: UPF0149 family protein [Pseudomonadota bacterium]